MKTIKEVIENLLEENYQLEKQNKKLKSQRDYWEEEYYEVVDENDKQDEYIKQLQNENTKLKQELEDFYYTRSKHKEIDFYIKALKNQLFNAYLKQEHQELLIKDLKLALSSYNNFVDEMFPD